MHVYKQGYLFCNGIGSEELKYIIYEMPLFSVRDLSLEITYIILKQNTLFVTSLTVI